MFGPIPITETPVSNWIFFVIFGLSLLFFARKTNQKSEFISHDDTQELKGLAIFAVLFAHIGYILVSDNSFLFPLSTLAGVGVDIFLLLSGYGLSMSMSKKTLTVWNFYKIRLLKIFIPFWVVFFVFLFTDRYLLHIDYSWEYIIESLMVWFPTADVWKDINSPFWYMSLLFFYYALFPIFFIKNNYWITGVLLMIFGNTLIYYDPLHLDTNWLHKLHTFAFPFGIILSWMANNASQTLKFYHKSRETYSKTAVGLLLIGILVLIFIMLWRIDVKEFSRHFSFFEKFGEVRVSIEQIKSLLLVSILVIIFSWKSWKHRLLLLFGTYSYEIYLIHWPLMARYDIFFHHLPAWLATIIWLFIFIIISKGIQMAIKKYG